MKTIKDLAEEAELIQNASNLSGVLLSAADAVIELRALLPAASHNVINTHPVIKAYASKIADMTGNYTGAYPADELRAVLECQNTAPGYCAPCTPAVSADFMRPYAPGAADNYPDENVEQG